MERQNEQVHTVQRTAKVPRIRKRITQQSVEQIVEELRDLQHRDGGVTRSKRGGSKTGAFCQTDRTLASRGLQIIAGARRLG